MEKTRYTVRTVVTSNTSTMRKATADT